MMIMEKHRKNSFVFNRFIYVNRLFPPVITLSLTSHLSFILWCRLIKEASSVENLCQLFQGWCPLWWRGQRHNVRQLWGEKKTKVKKLEYSSEREKHNMQKSRKINEGKQEEHRQNIRNDEARREVSGIWNDTAEIGLFRSEYLYLDHLRCKKISSAIYSYGRVSSSFYIRPYEVISGVIRNVCN